MLEESCDIKDFPSFCSAAKLRLFWITYLYLYIFTQVLNKRLFMKSILRGFLLGRSDLYTSALSRVLYKILKAINLNILIRIALKCNKYSPSWKLTVKP